MAIEDVIFILSPSEKPSCVQLSVASVSANSRSHPLLLTLATNNLFSGTAGVVPDATAGAVAVNLLPSDIAEKERFTLLTFASVVSAIFPTDISLPAV